MQSLSIVIPVYKDRERAVAAVAGLRRQVLPVDVRSEIIVVDDGSNDGTADFIRSRSDGVARLVELEQNSGRSAACNAGALASTGEVLFFLDCDCVPLGGEFLKTHLAALQDCIASTGPVVGSGSGFWDRYQRDAALRRARLYEEGIAYSGTSSNLAVLRSAFQRIGGFDVGYCRYGFEDRDLLFRLSEIGKIAWTSEAVVQHLDRLTLAGVSRKMVEAGEHSAARFRDRYPNAYKELGYARIDARDRKWLGWLARQFGPRLLRVAEALDPLLHNPWMPYPPAKAIVKLISAASFMYGTAKMRADHGEGAGSRADESQSDQV